MKGFIQNPENDLLLSQFGKYLSRQLGMSFQKTSLTILRKRVYAASKEFGFDDPVKCIRWLMQDNLSMEQIEILTGHITIGETYFFRGPESFKFLENTILPQIIDSYFPSHKEKKIRIWSAACSTGEEPYSIAMVLDKKKKELANFSTLILGTDINRSAIKKARQGIYLDWSFRTLPANLMEEHFTKYSKNTYEISSHLKKMVVFDYLNLVEDTAPGVLKDTEGMDIIFCRNVLMYFEKDLAQKVLANLLRSLKTGGWLIINPTDALNVKSPYLLRMKNTKVPIFRKTESLSSDFVPSNASTTAKTSGFIIPEKKTKCEEATELFKQGFYRQTISLLQSIPDLDIPCNKKYCKRLAAIFNLMAESYFRLAHWEDADKWCNKAIANYKHNVQYRYLSACIKMEQENERDAIIALKQCLYLSPNFVPAIYHIGRYAYQKGNLREAEYYFKKVLPLLEGMDASTEVDTMDKKLTAGTLESIIKGKMSKEAYH